MKTQNRFAIGIIALLSILATSAFGQNNVLSFKPIKAAQYGYETNEGKFVRLNETSIKSYLVQNKFLLNGATLADLEVREAKEQKGVYFLFGRASDGDAKYSFGLQLDKAIAKGSKYFLTGANNLCKVPAGSMSEVQLSATGGCACNGGTEVTKTSMKSNGTEVLDFFSK